MLAPHLSARFWLLAVIAASVLTACNQEPGDSAPSEVPASAPMDSSASA